MTTTLQTAAAAGQPDPNTMLTPNPAQQQASAPSYAHELQQFVDQWALSPTAQPGVRTWTDPASRAQPNGDFLAAWNDQPPVPATDPFDDAMAKRNAEAIKGITETAKPAAPAPTEQTPQGPYISPTDWNTINGAGGGGA